MKQFQGTKMEGSAGGLTGGIGNVRLRRAVDEVLDELMAKVAERIHKRPELVTKGNVFNLLTIAIDPSGAYSAPGMCHNANHAEIAFRDDGTICMLAEFKDYRTNSAGCWMGGYIPASRLVSFARDWLEQTAAPADRKAASLPLSPSAKWDRKAARLAGGLFRNLPALAAADAAQAACH